MNYFIANGSWVFLRYAVIILSGITLSSAFAHLVPQEVFGQYQFVLAFVSFLSVFSLPGLNTLSLREVIHHNERALIQSLRYSFIGSLLISIICGAYGVYNIFHLQTTIGWALIAASGLVPFFYAPNNWYVIYEGKLDFRSSTVRIIATQVGLLITLLIVLWFKASLSGLIFFYFLIPSIANIVFYIEAVRRISLNPVQAFDIRFAIFASVQKFLLGFGESLQVFAVSFLYGFEHLAIYQIAYFFVNAISGVTGAFSSLYFPLIIKYKKIHYFRIIVQNLVMGFFMSLAYICFLKLFFMFLYGEKYQKSLVLAYGFSALIFFTPLRLFLVTFFTANNNNKIIIYASVCANMLSLVVFYMLKGMPFSISVNIYLYTLILSFMLPVLGVYLVFASRQR